MERMKERQRTDVLLLLSATLVVKSLCFTLTFVLWCAAKTKCNATQIFQLSNCALASLSDSGSNF